jgi:hypothetical protein
MKQLVFTLEKIKAEPDDEVNLKYLQVFQHICNKSIIQMADLDIVKTVLQA